MKILTYPDKLLKVTADYVTNIDGKLVDIIEDMKFLMNEYNGLGLAATQVALDKRLFVYDKDKVIINPEIKDSGRKIDSRDEGCLSIPGLTFNIKRAEKIFVVGIDIDGNELELELGNTDSIIFQHEIDHLDGKLILDHLSNLKKKMYKKKIKKRVKFMKN